MGPKLNRNLALRYLPRKAEDWETVTCKNDFPKQGDGDGMRKGNDQKKSVPGLQFAQYSLSVGCNLSSMSSPGPLPRPLDALR